MHISGREIFLLKYYNKLLPFSALLLNFLIFPTLVEACAHDKAVCNWVNKVVIVRTGSVIASAVSLGNNIFVTNKHVVEDNLFVSIQDASGSLVDAYVLPNDHNADLVLLSQKKDLAIPSIHIQPPKGFEGLRGVGYGIGRGKIRVFPEGELISSPLETLKQARIHSTVRNLPGISGGALINKYGELIGILTSGSGSYNEAIPIHILSEVIARTGSSKQDFLDRGQAFKECSELLSYVNKSSKKLSKLFWDELKKTCNKTENKTLFDMVGQAFGAVGLLDDSISFLQKSVELDPNSPTSLLSLAIALQFKRAYERQVQVLEHLLQLVQDDPLVLRMSIQAAAFSKNETFAKKALIAMKENNSRAYTQALDFLKNYFESM